MATFRLSHAHGKSSSVEFSKGQHQRRTCGIKELTIRVALRLGFQNRASELFERSDYTLPYYLKGRGA